MIIFGGNGISGDYLSDTYCLDLVTMKWEQKITKGRKPIGRSRHSAFIHEDKMYIHGGKRHNKILSSVASLDLKTWTWSQQYEFYPKVAHYNFIYKDLLYCYGGFKSIRYILEENESNMLCFLNLKTGEKGILSLESNKAPEIENEMDYIEQTRMRVNFASACCLYQNKLVVVIPPCEPNGYLMGIYSLDLNTFTWNQHLNKEDGILLGSKPNESNNDSVSDMKFYLIGANVENKKNYLGSLLKIDLMEYGLFFNNQQTNTLSLPQSSLNFHNMFGNELMSDFKIYSNEKEQSYIPAHKFLLMTRWEHFKNLQDSGMKESELSYFIIPEAYNTTYHFLKYLYTDQLTTNNTHIIANLLVLGNLYDMKPLQMMCGEYLHQNIKVENVAHIYYQATKANELGLKKRAIKFMFHNFGKVVKSKGYQALSRQALIDFWCNLPTYAKIIA
ncbi:hypothetical protein K502DRAFT_288608 [Neoconidiobolus thromboides FSU 785]|nr:hypothetical protein K502DRAFT_288608 [Neoconidiobolus thromboides FSU 785]